MGPYGTNPQSINPFQIDRVPSVFLTPYILAFYIMIFFSLFILAYLNLSTCDSNFGQFSILIQSKYDSCHVAMIAKFFLLDSNI